MSESSTTEPVQDQEFSSCSKKIKLERDTDSEVTGEKYSLTFK